MKKKNRDSSVLKPGVTYNKYPNYMRIRTHRSNALCKFSLSYLVFLPKISPPLDYYCVCILVCTYSTQHTGYTHTTTHVHKQCTIFVSFTFFFWRILSLRHSIIQLRCFFLTRSFFKGLPF